MKRYMHRQRGLSLVELMVALTIGLFLLAGALSVFAKTRDLYRTNEQAARLQETARFAMSTIEADLRMASFWGLLNNPVDIRNRAPDPLTLPTGLPLSLQDEVDECGPNWAVDIERYVQFADAGFPLDCDPASDAVVDSDLVTVRFARANPMSGAALAASDGQIKLQASRTQGEIFAAATIPPDFLPPSSETRALVVHSYYVAQESDVRDTTPSLRRKRLAFAAGVPTVIDEEIVAGVEDLQIQVGWDTNADQNANFYTDPVYTDAQRAALGLPANAVPVALRLWLMVRAEQLDPAFTDDRTYAYGNRTGYAPADNFRRLLVSKTIMLRNTRR